MADIISGFWVSDVAFCILKKCLNPNHTHELLLLEEKVGLLLKLLLTIFVPSLNFSTGTRTVVKTIKPTVLIPGTSTYF